MIIHSFTRHICYLFVACCLLTTSLVGQQATNTFDDHILPISPFSNSLSTLPFPAFLFTKENTSFSPRELHDTYSSPSRGQFSSCYNAELAFFCRIEVKLEKATKIPVRFRLGDVQQVDYVERKIEGWRYNQ